MFKKLLFFKYLVTSLFAGTVAYSLVYKSCNSFCRCLECREKIKASGKTCTVSERCKKTTPSDLPLVVSSLPGFEGKVLLTFDDGPHLENTEKVLTILKEEGIKAVFFVVGDRLVQGKTMKPSRNAGMLKKIVAQKHVLGNHGFRHVDMRKFSYAQQEEAIEKTNQIIEQYQGRVRWFRPPGGSFNEDTQRVLKRLDMKMCLWSVDPQDWKPPRPAPDVLAKRILEKVQIFQDKHHAGSVILLHDIHKTTVNALKTVIQALRGAGIQFIAPQDIEKDVDIKKDVD